MKNSKRTAARLSYTGAGVTSMTQTLECVTTLEGHGSAFFYVQNVKPGEMSVQIGIPSLPRLELVTMQGNACTMELSIIVAHSVNDIASSS